MQSSVSRMFSISFYDTLLISIKSVDFWAVVCSEQVTKWWFTRFVIRSAIFCTIFFLWWVINQCDHHQLFFIIASCLLVLVQVGRLFLELNNCILDFAQTFKRCILWNLPAVSLLFPGRRTIDYSIECKNNFPTSSINLQCSIDSFCWLLST